MTVSDEISGHYQQRQRRQKLPHSRRPYSESGSAGSGNQRSYAASEPINLFDRIFALREPSHPKSLGCKVRLIRLRHWSTRTGGLTAAIRRSTRLVLTHLG